MNDESRTAPQNPHVNLAAPSGQVASPVTVDAPSDTERLDWLEANKDDVFHNGDDTWTVCRAPHFSITRKTLRAAVDAAMAQEKP